jgi:hypothetical protein
MRNASLRKAVRYLQDNNLLLDVILSRLEKVERISFASLA